MARRLPHIGELSRLCNSTHSQVYPAQLIDCTSRAFSSSGIFQSVREHRRSYAQPALQEDAPELEVEAAERRPTRYTDASA